MHFLSRLSLRIILPYTLSGKPLSEETILTDNTFIELKYARSRICLPVFLMASIGAAETKAEQHHSYDFGRINRKDATRSKKN
jgi:hypothetical protein